MIDTTKRYRLQKELFNWSTGQIVPAGEVFEQLPQTKKFVSKNGWFVSEDACLNKDYFMEVLPVSEPEKIKVGKMSCVLGYNIHNLSGMQWNLQFKTNKHIHYDNAVKLCNVLESALNDTVVEDESEEEKSYQRIAKFKDRYEKERPYSKSEVDAIRKEAFEAGRDRIGGFWNEQIKNWKYPSYFDYQKTVKIKSANLNTNDTGKEEQDLKMYEKVMSDNNEYVKGWKDGFNQGVEFMAKPTEQPTNDNAFVWDAEAALDFHNFVFRHENQFLKMGEYIEQFIASKQSAPVAQCPKCGANEIAANTPSTTYECGSSDYDQRPDTFIQTEKCKQNSSGAQSAPVDTGKCICKDGQPYSNLCCPIHGFTEFEKSEPAEPAPPSALPTKEWEIVTCYNGDVNIIHDYIPKNNPERSQSCDDEGCQIHSVRRLSDNTVFSVGSKWDNCEIVSFKKIGNDIEVCFSNGVESMDLMFISVPPTPITDLPKQPVVEDKPDSLTMESRAFYAGMDGRYKTFSDYKQKK